MPLFVCAKCQCVENTAMGLYWERQCHTMFRWTPSMEKYKNQGLCTACAPTHFTDGKMTGYGRWHGKFPKEHYRKVSESERAELLQVPETVS